MVDFQSRDRRRDEEDEEEAGNEERAADEDATDEPADHEHDGGHNDDEDDDEHHHHNHHAPDDPIAVAVVTVSSSRSRDDDPSGDAIVALLEEADIEIATRDVLLDDHDGIQSAVNALVGRSDVDAVITTGGTGITPDDVTVEAVHPLFDKRLPGFGELFRHLSYDEIGTRTIATRATAGLVGDVPVFCLPGSENAARLGTGEIIVEELPHLVGLATRE